MQVAKALPSSSPLTWKNFLIGGQSNAEGRGFATDLTGSEFPRANRVRVRNGSGWLLPGTEPTYPGGSGVGFGMSFANALAAALPNVGIGVANSAYGGSSMADWATMSPLSSLYGRLINQGRLILQSGETIDGLLWHQGESDAMISSTIANAWATNFLAMVAAIRTDLGIANLPVVYAVINAFNDPVAFPYWSNVKASQSGIDLTGRNMARVSTDDLAVRTDSAEQGVHLSTAGQLVLGPRMAMAMQTLL